MKPCADKQKLITWLALDALDVHTAQTLHAHLKTCNGCRSYLAEISRVKEQLAAAKPSAELQASEAFHRNAVARMKAETPVSIWATMGAALRPVFFNWRVAVPVAAVVFLFSLRIWITQSPRVEAPLRPVATVPPVSTPVMAAADAATDLTPTIANYQRVASQSLDKLDELLGEQEKQTARTAPVYTASASALGF